MTALAETQLAGKEPSMHDLASLCAMGVHRDIKLHYPQGAVAGPHELQLNLKSDDGGFLIRVETKAALEARLATEQPMEEPLCFSPCEIRAPRERKYDYGREETQTHE